MVSAEKCIDKSDQINEKDKFFCKFQLTTDKFGMYYTIISTRNTFMQSLTENGLENCKENPLRILPRTSLAAKAVATPKVYITEENFSTVKCMI